MQIENSQGKQPVYFPCLRVFVRHLTTIRRCVRRCTVIIALRPHGVSALLPSALAVGGIVQSPPSAPPGVPCAGFSLILVAGTLDV